MQLRYHGERSKAGGENPLVPQGSFAGHAALVLRKPDSLRIEPLSPFGTPLVVVVARGASFRAYSPSRNTVYMGRTNRQGIEGMLGIPLNSEIFIKLLLGDWAVVMGGEENLALKKRGSVYALEMKSGAGGVVSGLVELEPRDFHAVKMEIRTRRGAIAVRYGGFIKTGNVWRPSQVEILAPGGKNRLRISYPADEGAVDTALPDDLFRLEPAPGRQNAVAGRIAGLMSRKDVSTPLVLKTPAKLNLCLKVLGLRADGYHEIVTWMQQVSLYDEVHIEPGGERILVHADRDDVPGGGENIVHRAARALRAASGRKALGARISLKKNIPAGAGLGGGKRQRGGRALGAEPGLESRDGPGGTLRGGRAGRFGRSVFSGWPGGGVPGTGRASRGERSPEERLVSAGQAARGSVHARSLWLVPGETGPGGAGFRRNERPGAPRAI